MLEKLTIGKRIALVRKDAGLSQVQCAKLIEISRDLLAQIETNRQNPSIDFLIKFVRLTNTSYAYIIEGRQNETAQELGAKNIAPNIAPNVAPNDKRQNETAQERAQFYNKEDFDLNLVAEPEARYYLGKLEEEIKRLKVENIKLREKNEAFLEMARAMGLNNSKTNNNDNNSSQQSA